MWGSMNSGSMVRPNLLDIAYRRLRKSMIAILCNSNIYFVVFFVQGLKLLALMPQIKPSKFQQGGFQPQIQYATCLLQLFP